MRPALVLTNLGRVSTIKQSTQIDLSELATLVAEDNSFMRNLIRRMLLGLGVRTVFDARDGSEALDVIGRERTDLVLCDWLMDPLDGADFTRIIRSAPDSPNQAVPIIMVSGYTEGWRVSQARDAGVNEILAKPLSADRLLSRVVYLIENPRAFIDTMNYKGPDRRRRKDARYSGSERRKTPYSYPE